MTVIGKARQEDVSKWQQLYHQTTEYRVTHNHQEKMPLTIGGKFMI